MKNTSNLGWSAANKEIKYSLRKRGLGENSKIEHIRPSREYIIYKLTIQFFIIQDCKRWISNEERERRLGVFITKMRKGSLQLVKIIEN